MPEDGISDPVGLEAERSSVAVIEALEEALGCECSSPGCACFDPGRLVHFVTEGGDLGAPGCGDAADVQRRAPMEPEAQRQVVWVEDAGDGDVADGDSEVSHRSDACPSGG